MLSVTGGTVLPGEPSSWMVEVKLNINIPAHREPHILVNTIPLRGSKMTENHFWTQTACK